MAAVPVDDGGGDLAEEADGDLEPAPDEGAADIEVTDMGGRGEGRVALLALPAEGLHEQGAADGEGLLHLGRHRGQLRLGLVGEGSLDLADAAGREDEDGDDDD